MCCPCLRWLSAWRRSGMPRWKARNRRVRGIPKEKGPHPHDYEHAKKTCQKGLTKRQRYAILLSGGKPNGYFSNSNGPQGKAGRLKGRFAQEWMRLFGTVLGMVCMGVFLCACDTPDVMTGAACSCWRPEPLTTSCLLPENLSFDGFVIFGYGNIQEVTVQGGKDVDWSFPQENDPDFSYCDPNCGEGEMGEICYWDGLPKQCRLTWENINTPYVWTVSGYVENFELDTDPGPPHFKTAYIETKVNYDPEQQPRVNIRVVRRGAFQPEFTVGPNGLVSVPNEAELDVSFNLIPPSTYNLRAAIPEGVSFDGSLLKVAGDEAGLSARKQDSEDPALEDTLSGRYSEQRDRHILHNYDITWVVEPTIPNNYYECPCECPPPENCMTWEQLLTITRDSGYDIWVMGEIFYIDPSTNICSEVWGLAVFKGPLIWLSTKASPLKRTFLHEFGHNVGLDHVLIPYNVMYIGYERGSDINSNQTSNFITKVPKEYNQY